MIEVLGPGVDGEKVTDGENLRGVWVRFLEEKLLGIEREREDRRPGVIDLLIGGSGPGCRRGEVSTAS